MLAGAEKPDGTKSVPRMNISMKPQKITPKYQGTVRQLFFKRIKAAFLNPQFQTDVYKPLRIDDFIDQEVQNLSGGELQRVAIVLALGIPADIYLIDEPSAYLDAERKSIWMHQVLMRVFPNIFIERVTAARVIKRFIMNTKKTAFIVEHDFIMATYLADRVIVFDGQPSVDARANVPESLLTGCNRFLENLDVTFRRDPNSFRPRINKYQSQLDQEQKLNGNYVSLSSYLTTESFFLFYSPFSQSFSLVYLLILLSIVLPGRRELKRASHVSTIAIVVVGTMVTTLTSGVTGYWLEKRAFGL